MARPARDDSDREPTLLRASILVAAALALVGLALAFAGARDRIADAEAAAAIGRNANDLVITQPVEPSPFGDTVIWGLPSQRARFLDDGGQPIVRVATGDAGALVGLEGPQGLVGLSLLPPGLDPPGELLVSPASTALALAALHPSLMSGDPATHRARMAAALSAPSFPALVAQVDGRPLATWGEGERSVLRQVVEEAIPTSLSMPCADSQVVAGAISRCAGAAQLVNSSHRSVAVVDGSGQLCAVIPGAAGLASAAVDEALTLVVATGEISPLASIDAVPGVASVACDSPSLPADEAAAELGQRAAALADVATATARLLGADDALTPVVELDESVLSLLASLPDLPAGPATAGGQWATGVDLLATPTGPDELGLLPLGAPTLDRLRELASLLQSLFA